MQSCGAESTQLHMTLLKYVTSNRRVAQLARGWNQVRSRPLSITLEFSHIAMASPGQMDIAVRFPLKQKQAKQSSMERRLNKKPSSRSSTEGEWQVVPGRSRI
jgi:hypothetical protein